jgi:RHS repeat-associated protein
VLFDNFGIEQITGPVLEETHYYPFGLTMSGISTVAPLKLEGKRKFNGIEFNHKEFSDGSGLDLYTAKFRGLDPQIGRWWQIDPEADNLESLSPYEGMGDNPINNADPLGDFKHKFGAWLYKIFHGGGEIGRNRFDEYYVAQTNVSRGKDDIATVTTKMIYGKGRDQYSAGREKLLKEIDERQDIDEMTRMGIWDPTLTPEEARRNLINNSLGLALPVSSVKGFLSLFKTSNKIFKTVDDLISRAGKLDRLKGGVKQGTVKGNVNKVFKSISKGGRQIEPNRFQLPDGTIITKYPSSTTGVPTIGINKGGVLYKIRVE